MEGSYFKYSQLKILRPGVTVGSMSIDLRWLLGSGLQSKPLLCRYGFNLLEPSLWSRDATTVLSVVYEFGKQCLETAIAQRSSKLMYPEPSHGRVEKCIE